MWCRTILAVLLAFAAVPALAGGDSVPPVGNDVVRQECGACHMAFQPAFLPARSWGRLVDGLGDHFGEEVTMAADKMEIVRAYLTANAGDVTMQGRARKYMRWVAPGAAPLRITENPDFQRKHRFPDSVWQDPKVVTRSNCLACHAGAEQGRYEGNH
jgi:cytochrome c5